MKEGKRTTEPFWWGLFAVGGMVAAMFMPVHLLLTGILTPSRAIDAPTHAEAYALFSNWAFRVYLCVLITLPLFHWAHRFRAAFMDFGLRAIGEPVAFILYAVAIGGSIFAVVSVFSL